jgi:hypothetical protein
MGPGQRPWSHDEDVPHFDRERHFRTHERDERRRQEQQRWRRQQRRGVEGQERNGGYLVNFLFVGGIIGLGVFVPSFLYETMVRGSKRKEG